MKLLVTGTKGQVVTSLIERAAARGDAEIIALGRPQLDLADPETVARALDSAECDVIVSAAAYTAVDRAEDEPDLAMAVNAAGAEAVARAAAARRLPVIHLSTDYVFSGSGDRPWTEDDLPAPQCVYGMTKLEGERRVAAANPRHLILRTAWVYSPFGGNFVRTMLRLARERDEVAVVADQWGNPTSALDIADAILHLAPRLRLDGDAAHPGVCHLAGSGTTNWAGFARHVFDASARFGGPQAAVRDIATADYPTRARRPLNSRLSTDRLHRLFGWRAPDWRNSTDETVRRLLGGTAD